MRPDPLASLARMRRLQTGSARRRLAEDGDRLLASAAATWIAVPRDHIPGTAA